jgi:hypothetical protein
MKLSPELKAMGFISKSDQLKNGTVGCCTMPCFQGKYPDQKTPTIGCAIIQSMCDKSPAEQLKEAR